MISFIKEEILLWKYLKTAGKPIVLYGTGDGADKVAARLAAEEVNVAGVFASDEFVRGQQFYGHTVRKYSELVSMDTPVIVLICFASELPEQLERFYRLAQIHETYAPHVPVFAGDGITDFAWLAEHESELQDVYDRLADDFSRNVFAAVLNYRISGKLKYLQDCTTDRAQDLKTIFAFGSAETYVDAGAFSGDTIEEFLQLIEHKNYKRIFAIEPDPKNYKKLTTYVKDNQLANITCVQAGVWNDCGVLELTGNGGRQSTLYRMEGPDRVKELQFGDTGLWGVGSKRPVKSRKIKRQQVAVVTIDRVLDHNHADYMKFDVEGAEKEALAGAKMHLVPDRHGNLPKLLIAAYHHDEDIFALPLLLWKMRPDYKIYLRKHPYVPAWEINFFAN